MAAICMYCGPQGKCQTPTELIMNCLLSEFQPDSSYHNQHSIRYTPRLQDNLFLREEVHVSNFEKMSRAEFERRLEGYQYDEFRSYYFKVMSRGVSNQSIFQDYEYRTDNAVDIKFTYIRYLFPNVANVRDRFTVISIAYSAYIPRVWDAQEKWSGSLEHFKEKILKIEELFNDCRSPLVSD
jgi:hypothetical protein